MQKTLLKYTYILMILIFNYQVVAQHNHINIKQFAIEAGISQSVINCLLQDHNGFLWIGTQDGLNRYDGYQFKHYRHDASDTSSISNNYIQSIYEDDNHNLWISTEAGLNKFDRKAQKFKRYLNEKDNRYSLGSNNVFCVYEDINSIFWVKHSLGLDKFEPISERFFSYAIDVKDFFVPSVSLNYNNFTLLEDDKNNLWLGTNYGLNFFSKKHLQFHNYEPRIKTLSSQEVRVLYTSKDSNIWVGTASGLNLFDKKTKKFKSYYVNPNDKNDVRNSINVIWEDKNNMFWIGTDFGLKLFNPKTKKFQNPDGIKLNERILSIIQDKSNIFWIGTNSSLYKINKQKNKFQLFSKNKTGIPNFTSNDIRTIYQDKNGLLWLGTVDDGLNIFDRKTGNVIQYTKQHPFNKIKSNQILNIFKDRNNHIFLSTSKGVQIFDLQSKKFIDADKKFGEDWKRITNTNARVFLEDSDGYLWIGTDKGIFKFRNYKFVDKYKYSSSKDALSADMINSFLEDSEQDIWIGTRNGFDKYDKKTNSFKRYESPNYPLSNNSVISIYQSDDSLIWIGTLSGLNKFNKKTEEFSVYTQKNGFKNDCIYEILEDNHKNLWLTTNRGIVKFNRETEKIINYDLQDGLQGYEYNAKSYFKSKDGELFFGGLNGFNSFYPDSIEENQHKPDIVITSFTKMNSEGKSELWQENSEEIIINYDDFNINIEFSALEFTHPENNHYQYKLEGYDNEWRYLGNRNYAVFSQLPYGDDYVFKVKASNSDLVWNENYVSFKLIVKSSFWNNNIAYVVYLCLVILSVYLMIWFRTRNVRRENQILKERDANAQKVSQQKDLLSIKNQNITDSLNYAKRIIESLMPSEKTFRNSLSNSFILNIPKDIVSGDFFWVAEKNNKIYFAAVDCTGHGVPGSFMSIIGIDLLKNVIQQEDVNHPNEIIQQVNQDLAKALKKNIEDEDMIRDGMDMALCMIDYENSILEYSGAINPLYMIRDNEIKIIKANRFSLGPTYEEETKIFTNHIIEIRNNDLFYIFSDGYADQFGGEKEKKFKYANMRQLLLDIHTLEMNEQKRILQQNILSWKGNLEQVDDILFIGVKI